jgi:hypothetical protein
MTYYTGIFKFNLKDFYDVSVELIKMKKTGKNEIKEKITLLSCLIIDD